MSSVAEIIRTRRSVRGFRPDEVPGDVLRDIFELAQFAPSNCNVQPWNPHVVSGESAHRLREKLLAAGRNRGGETPDFPIAQGVYAGVHKVRQYDAAAQLYGAMGVERKDLEGRYAAYLRNFAFFDAPHAVFIFMPADFGPREATDCGIYAQTLMLAMAEKGVASCAQGALSLHPPVVREHLGLGDDQRLLLGVSFGYEDPTTKANSARVGREALDQAVVFHR